MDVSFKDLTSRFPQAQKLHKEKSISDAFDVGQQTYIKNFVRS